MVNGINHITFAIINLEQSINFYVNLLGLRLVEKWNEGAYLMAGNQWIALNVDEARITEPTGDYTHIAFNVLPTDFKSLKEKLEKSGIKSFKENTSEGESFYFLDPDGHKLELHCNTLEDRLNWMRENNWWTFKRV